MYSPRPKPSNQPLPRARFGFCCGRRHEVLVPLVIALFVCLLCLMVDQDVSSDRIRMGDTHFMGSTATRTHLWVCETSTPSNAHELTHVRFRAIQILAKYSGFHREERLEDKRRLHVATTP
jgi:hypothetical protein